jgi:hypothetical protein
MNMNAVEQLAEAAMKLDPRARAQLVERLLESLETLSEEENKALWIEEAKRRDKEMDAEGGKARPADDVFREARSRLS